MVIIISIDYILINLVILSFTCKKAIISYQIQLRNDGIENYVRRIDRTSYIEPYGTTTLYIDDKRGK